MNDLIILGFTGIRSGMTSNQKEELEGFLIQNKNVVSKGIHGGCTGADEYFHNLCIELEIPVEVYPGYSMKNPDDLRYRAELKGSFVEHEPMTYFKRNREIVNKSDLILGVVRSYERVGGTWYTLDYAEKEFKQIYIFKPINE